MLENVHLGQGPDFGSSSRVPIANSFMHMLKQAKGMKILPCAVGQRGEPGWVWGPNLGQLGCAGLGTIELWGGRLDLHWDHSWHRSSSDHWWPTGR